MGALRYRSPRRVSMDWTRFGATTVELSLPAPVWSIGLCLYPSQESVEVVLFTNNLLIEEILREFLQNLSSLALLGGNGQACKLAVNLVDLIREKAYAML